jgi:hypothetical protein
MEYLKLTNGIVTIKVVDQTNPDNASWPFQVLIKKGSSRFQDVDSRTNLESAVDAAVNEFRQVTYFQI